jgi:tetratricopeptide (TPR) repeat protein
MTISTKPRAFIGSSVEGLTIAYAVQQNLLHSTEITVWDQGVFELSSTTIESLSKALDSNDFGIFVFSPDDITKMRGSELASVRDNVLFEMGLFVGKLGRERVFFLVPDSDGPHIPSDLLGVTPAKFETKRTDNSMQAATGAACHQIRQQIERLGKINQNSIIENTPDESSEKSTEEREWIHYFIQKKYQEAKSALEAKIKSQTGDDALKTQSWIHYCSLKLDESDGITNLLEFSKKNKNSAVVQQTVARILRLESYLSQAIKLLKSVEQSIINYSLIVTELAHCHIELGEREEAIKLLKQLEVESDPQLALLLADTLENHGNKKEALNIIHNCYIRNPKSKPLQYKYARLAQELDLQNVALYFLDALTNEEENSIDYWGYLGNACVALDLYDRALVAYRRAEALIDQEGDGEWIVSNIGNILNYRGFSSEACQYLQKAISMNPDSKYSHDKLAHSLRSRDKEIEEYKKKIAEGLRFVRNKELESMEALGEFTENIVSTSI